MGWLVNTCNKLLVTLLLALPLFAQAQSNSLRLTEFEVTRNDADHVEASAVWLPITLPDSWSQHRDNNRRNAWYRASVPVQDLPRPLAVYLPRLSMNAAVSINGSEIGNGGRFSEPIARNHGRPLVFFIPDTLIQHSDVLSLAIRVADNEWALGYLGPVYVGEAVSVNARYRSDEFWQVHIPHALAVVMLIFAGASFLITLQRRRESYYFWFGSAMLLLALDTFNVFVNPIPVERKLWEVYNQTVIFAFATATILFIHRFTGVGWKPMEPILWALLAGKILILPFMPIQQFFPFANGINLITIGYGVVLLFLITRNYLKTKRFETGLTAAAGLILLSVALHTWLVQTGLLIPEHQHLMHLGAPGFFILISLFIVKRFLRALDTQEQLTNQLELRVEQKENELAETYAKMSEIRQQQILSDERERIMREMHDGFGGQLIGALSILESDRRSHQDAATLLRTALLDLRVMIDSLDSHAGELSVALGMLRTRINPILQRRNIVLHWDVQQLPETIRLKPKHTLNLLRIVQELITNIIKHSRATQIKLTADIAAIASTTLQIRLWENGDGFDPALNKGRGLNNLDKRICTLHGQLNYRRVDDGFVIDIVVPDIENAN